MTNPIIVLGAGIAGLGAAYKLSKENQCIIVLEKDDTYGGLCGNFTIDGFRFDRFVHFSFSKNEEVNKIFSSGSPEVYHHIPNPFNLYRGLWIKHPAQNNLFPLPKKEKERIIEDFRNRPDADSVAVNNYEQWLRIQYGNYFAEHFPMAYTRKYWMTEAMELETGWVGKRLYQPSLDEVLRGAQSSDTPITYYSKEMRYPVRGGYKQYLAVLAEGKDIRYNQLVVKISPQANTLYTANGVEYTYSRLISSLPLPMIMSMLTDVPEYVLAAANQLRCTCGYQISVGMKTKNIPPYLWWYVYDEDILPARVYSPSLKSPNNVPEGCSSLQMEVYCNRGEYTQEELLARSVGKLVSLKIIKKEDILFTDVRFEPYANVIFDHNIYEARKIVRDYLSSIGIETIGRFGEWGYLWSDQSLMSGLNIEQC